MSVTRDGKESVLIAETMTLATNSIDGDKTSRSVASISIPVDGSSAGTIRTIGNASVGKPGPTPDIALMDGMTEMRGSGDGDLFVVARVRLQRNTGVKYFDFLFGRRSQCETSNNRVRKHAHITVYPDGNGKFIELRGHNCDIESQMQYIVGSGR